MVENAELLRMTGAELKEIWDASKLDDDQIKPIFGFSRSTLYNKFDLDKVPIEIESIIDKHKILSQWKNAVLNKGVNVSQPTPDAQMKVMSEMMQMLAQTITMSISQSITQVSDLFTKQMEKREKDYELIRRNNENLLGLVEDARKGVISLAPQKR